MRFIQKEKKKKTDIQANQCFRQQPVLGQLLKRSLLQAYCHPGEAKGKSCEVQQTYGLDHMVRGIQLAFKAYIAV